MGPPELTHLTSPLPSLVRIDLVVGAQGQEQERWTAPFAGGWAVKVLQ